MAIFKNEMVKKVVDGLTKNPGALESILLKPEQREVITADQAAVLSHLHNTEVSEMDALTAKGWLAVHEMLLKVRHTITELAKNKFQ